MGDPSAAPEALGTRLRTLLAATQGDPEAAPLEAEELAFWAALAPDVAEDVGVFLATTKNPVDALVARLRAMLDAGLAGADGSGVGVLRLAIATFHGLKVAKRWDALQLASVTLVNTVAEAIQQHVEDGAIEVLLCLMELYEAILLGYQHDGSLLVQAHPQIVTLAPLIAAIGHEDLVRRFLVTSLALVHSQRAYESEKAAIEQCLVDAFSVELVRRPVAECESALRDAAWIVPAAKANKYITTVEGKWVQDEFSSEQHASAAAAPQNAGSITLRKVANVLAYDLHGTIDDTRGKIQLQLDGALIRPLDDNGHIDSNAPWQLEGHWAQVVSPASHDTPVQLTAPMIKAEPWNCSACTFSNEGGSLKCATCGTEAPKNSSSQITKAGAKTTNPAPFLATFDAEQTVMRVRWSRGEQSGVWLARKDMSNPEFSLSDNLSEVTASAMADSNAIPACAYSPRGDASRVLLLEKPYSLSTYGEMAIEFWVQVDSCSSEREKQTILSTGEFEVFFQSGLRDLVWEIGSGLRVVTAPSFPDDGQFHHIVLLFKKQYLQILFNGVVVGHSDRSISDQGNIVARRTSWVSIGGCVSDDLTQMSSVFHGALLDMRIWSDLNARGLFSPLKALNGSEAGLIGYFPLVGESPRILLDASKHDNHATVFGCSGYRYDPGTLKSRPTNLFFPSSPVGTIPVERNFSTAVGSFEISGVAAHCDVHGKPALRLNHPSAVWHSSPVSVDKDFQAVVTIESTELVTSHANQLVFALSEASFWDASPLISEVTCLGLPFDKELNEHLFSGTALFVVTERFVVDGSSTPESAVAVYVWKNHRPVQVCRVAKLPARVDGPTGLAVSYARSTQVLRVEIVGSGTEVEVAIDIETALSLQSRRLRTGVILASPLLVPSPSSTASPYTTLLTSWTFKSFDEQRLGVGVIDTMYSRLKQTAGPGNAGSLGAGADVTSPPTIACTRTTSDGSAIKQATYGCQTCGVVHGAGLCNVCAIICHEGHDLVYMGSMITACACSMRSVGSCKCLSPVIVSEHPNLVQSTPKVSQWYCSRCTVVNAAGVRECSVCANVAPDNSVLGLANAADNASDSTSRALVPVQPANTPLAVAASTSSEWSCPACTYLNSSTATKCTICESAKPDGVPSGDGLLALYDAIESQKGQTTSVSVPQGGSSWYCSACTMENKGGDTSCFMCQTPRIVPVASEVKSEDLSVGQPVPTAEVISLATPMETDSTTASPPLHLGVDRVLQTTREVVKLCCQYALESSRLSGSELNLIGSEQVWDSTTGLLTMSVTERALSAQYVEGEYAEKDGYLRGLCRLLGEDEVQWKLDGRFKKLTQSQENAVSLVWEKDMSRFSGKWYRGDGSGEWKCLSAPLVNDFRGLAPVDASKRDSSLQPFYSGLINMKQNLTNVCYQNSFLQSLYLTQDFRRLILASKADEYLHMTVDGERNTQGNVLKSVQDLFARLIASQRTEIDSHGLQRCLPASFQAGRQQDTSDFAHFLIDSLSQQLNQHPSTVHGIDEVFGGTQATILACKTCGKKSVNREYFWELLLNMIDLRYTPITSISAVSGTSAVIPTPRGYERINSDLNKDRNGAPYVYLCVKRRPEVSVDGSDVELPITDLVVRVAGFADTKPVLDGYERVELDLNIGGSSVVAGGKKQVYLFFRREPNGSPITDLQLIYGNESVPDGFKQIRVDLNQGEGTKVFLCYRCDMPITDMKIVNSGIPGYRMVDHVLNCSNEDTIKQYLAFKVGGSEPCITDLRLVPASEEARYHEKGWESLGSPSSTVEEDVEPEILVVRRGHGNPIFAVDVFRAPRQVPRYNDYEVIDLYGSQASMVGKMTGNIATTLKGDWLGDETVDRARKSVRIHSVSDPIPEPLIIKGSFEDKGEVNAIATASASWTTPSASDLSGASLSRILRVTGHWKSSKTKQAQLFDVELRPGGVDSVGKYMLSGTIGDGRGRPIAITGTQTSSSVRVKWPISQIFVLRGDERVPEGAEVVRETCSGRTGNLLAQTQSPHTLYIAVKREENPSDSYVGDICVIYGEIDVVPEDYTCIQTTPSGHSANLNDGTSGVPIFICYRRVVTASDKSLMDVALMWTSGTQADTLPAGFTKIQHTPLGMEANLNQGTSGVSIYLCFAKADPSEIVRPVDDALNGEYEIVVAASTSNSSSLPPLIGSFIRLAVAERAEAAYTIEGKFGTVFHGYQPGMIRGTLYRSEQRKKRVVAGVWMSDEQNASSMIDFVPPSFPFEWTLNDANNELDGWWCGPDDASSISYITTPSAGTASSANAGSTPLPLKSWKLMKDAYVRLAFKKDYGTEWKDGELVSSERVWRHDVASMLSRFVASRTLGGDNLLSCSQCERKTESRTNTVVVAPPAHLILTIKRMFYDWAQQKTRKSLHDVTFPALLTLPALTSEDEDAVYDEETTSEVRDKYRQRQYGLYGVLVHSGLTANSGHYFSYCRESDDSTKQLHLEDSTLTPWIKFNDSRVERSSWAEINAAVSNSVSDSVYLLLYKRLSYEVPEHTQPHLVSPESTSAMDIEHTDDEDEAMLLAKAMALSMSAASQRKAQSGGEIKDEETKEEGTVGEKSKNQVRHRIDRSVVREVEAANAQYLWDTMRTAASAVHVQDLHNAVALRYGLTTSSVRDL